MKVSIIVPVYNSEIYIEQAVKSLVYQEFNDFEILLIDDGSTDGSSKICDDLAKKYTNILVIHKQNGGMCSARNMGIDFATGKYIMFMDNDDICLEGFIKDNYYFAEKNNADCVRFGRNKIEMEKNNKIGKKSTLYPKNYKVLRNEDKYIFYKELRQNGNGVWSGLYKRSFLIKNSIKFDETLFSGHEDTLFNLRVYEDASTIVLNPKVYYCWIQRPLHSSSTHFNKNRIYGILKALYNENQLMLKYNINQNDVIFYSRQLMKYLSECLKIGWKYGNSCTYDAYLSVYKELSLFLNQFNIHLRYLPMKDKIRVFLLKHNMYHIIYYLYKCKYFLEI